MKTDDCLSMGEMLDKLGIPPTAVVIKYNLSFSSCIFPFALISEVVMMVECSTRRWVVLANALEEYIALDETSLKPASASWLDVICETPLPSSFITEGVVDSAFWPEDVTE